MKKKGIAKESDLQAHLEKSPKVAHGVWQKVLEFCHKIFISDVPPTADDGEDGDIWFEH